MYLFLHVEFFTWKPPIPIVSIFGSFCRSYLNLEMKKFLNSKCTTLYENANMHYEKWEVIFGIQKDHILKQKNEGQS